ncbi:polyhomeotic-like protein 2 isoform X3 [Zalophus californianus]|uniref:Polyhomeotic-like protein 2 isoform X3 n=1 Tax=Zalophus californianus TaxID=9704 RepID=A0A6J2DZ83_ZALCA|nr:polyhomeotic-like protein 2 isoform X3 [Zalophus californianus]
MENELPVPQTSSSAGSACYGSSSGGSGRPSGPQISVYSGIPDRQTVQVIQQALHRPPSTAAQYLQQMYAAQQQHLMLQTAALQQQHLSSAQLQSLAAVQQASLVANRQGSTSGSSVSAQAPAQSSSINLAASPAAAQLINRAQSVNSATASGIAQQAVLLGNTSSPALTASQAQMYLRAQMLIFTPTATVATVQPELGTGSPARPPTPAQVQNLTLRTQQQPTAAASGPTPTQPVLPSLALKPTPGGSQPLPTPSQGRNTAQGSPAGAKPGITDSVMEPLRKGDANSSVPGSMEGRAGLSRMAPAVATHPLVAPAYAQLQPHQLLSQPPSKHLQPQFVLQQQPQPPAPPPLPQARPALQAQPHPQPASVPPSLTLQPSPEAHAMPLGPVTPALPLQCPTTSLHKAGGTQQCHPPTPDAGPHNGYPEGLAHTPQRRFQHASAVILQLQPASPVPQQCAEDDWKEAVPGEKSVPETRSGPSPHQQAIITAMPGGLPVPKSPNVQQPPAHETGQGIVHALTDLSSPGMTSGNGNSASSITGTAPQNGENKPPQAIVKPQILTHVIEGFVIQEGAEPFPVGRSSLLVGNLKKKYAQGFLPEKLPQQDHTTTTDSEMEEPYLQESKEEGTPLKLKCELCGRVDFAYKFKRSKRFCSMACAKRLPGNSRGVPCPGDRWASPAAAQGGPPDECYEHQAGACPEDLCSHQHAQGLLGLAGAARVLARGSSSRLSRARQTFLRGPEMGPVGGKGSPYGAWLVRRSWHPLNGSQGPFSLWEGQRGRWRRRWGFMLVNIDSTGFLQSPNTLAPLSSPLSVPHFPGGIRSGLPNLSWVTFKGSCQVWIEALQALACLSPTSFSGPG